MNRLQRALDTLVERIDTPAPIVLVDVTQDNIDRRQGFAKLDPNRVCPIVGNFEELIIMDSTGTSLRR